MHRCSKWTMASLLAAGGKPSRGRMSVHALPILTHSQGKCEPCLAPGHNTKYGYMRKVSMRIALSQLASCVYALSPLRPRVMFVRITQRLQKTPEYRSMLRRVVVFLLALICIATGCARSTAQNQTSSPGVRQSTPPRSKAKAPVTTVRPKAPVQPAQPAQPQQGEEQGGRIF